LGRLSKGGGPDDGLLQEQGVQAVGERGVAGQLVAAGDLVEEGAGLVDEAVVVAGADARGVHRQAAGDVGVVDADDDAAEAVGAGGDLELTRAAHVERHRAALAEDLELERVRVTARDP
jgi:hypothetical protein